MKLRVVLTPAAEQDIEESFLWYEDKAEGLGDAFRRQVRAAFDRVKARPLSFPIVEEDTRRVLLHKFSHAIYFILDRDRAVVTACVHESRDPQVWRSRR